MEGVRREVGGGNRRREGRETVVGNKKREIGYFKETETRCLSVGLESGSLLPQLVPERSNPGHQLLGASDLLF